MRSGQHSLENVDGGRDVFRVGRRRRRKAGRLGAGGARVLGHAVQRGRLHLLVAQSASRAGRRFSHHAKLVERRLGRVLFVFLVLDLKRE